MLPIRSVVVGLALAAEVASFAIPSARTLRAAPLEAAPSDAADTLFASQEASLASIKEALHLEAKDYPASLSLDSFAPTTGGSGALASFEAPGADNVAWCSDLRVTGGDVTLASLTVWCGPMKDVPHLVCRTTVTASAVDLYIDFRPRAAVGYETMLEDGTYPEPDSREAFMAKGERADFEKRFYADAGALLSGCGGEKKGPPASDLEVAQRSPVALDVTLPASPESVEAAAGLCSDAAAKWLEWAQDDQHLLKPGMQVTSTYARDTKLRANNYALLVDAYSAVFGDQGTNLAAGDAGPLDEAYVGGAS